MGRDLLEVLTAWDGHLRPSFRVDSAIDDAHGLMMPMDYGLIQMLFAALLFVKSRSGVVSRTPAVA